MHADAISTHQPVPGLEVAAAATPAETRGFWSGQPCPRLKHFTDDGEPFGTPGSSVLEVAMMGKHPAHITVEYASQQADVCCHIGKQNSGSNTSRRDVIAAAGEALTLGVVHPDRRSLALVRAIAALPT